MAKSSAPNSLSTPLERAIGCTIASHAARPSSRMRHEGVPWPPHRATSLAHTSNAAGPSSGLAQKRRGLAPHRDDLHPPPLPFAVALGDDAGEFRKGEVHDAPVAGAHRLEG